MIRTKYRKAKRFLVAGAVTVAAAASALAVPPDLDDLSTGALEGVGAGISAGLPVASGIAALTIAVLVFKKVRSAGS